MKRPYEGGRTLEIMQTFGRETAQLFGETVIGDKLLTIEKVNETFKIAEGESICL